MRKDGDLFAFTRSLGDGEEAEFRFLATYGKF